MPAMNIRPSAAIRQNYNEIADLCRKTSEPKLREELLAVKEDRLHGSEGYSIDEVTSMMRSAIQEAAGHGTAK